MERVAFHKISEKEINVSIFVAGPCYIVFQNY
jgi:hypothetical protein